jgi:hypothetical protein
MTDSPDNFHAPFTSLLRLRGGRRIEAIAEQILRLSAEAEAVARFCEEGSQCPWHWKITAAVSSADDPSFDDQPAETMQRAGERLFDRGTAILNEAADLAEVAD